MLDLTLIVICASIIVFFSEEIFEKIKAFLAIPFIQLLFPLTVLSWVVSFYEKETREVLLFIKHAGYALISYLAILWPWTAGGWSLASLIVLLFFTLGPVFLIDYSIRRDSHHVYNYKGLTTTLIWVFLVVLMTVRFSY